MGSARGEFLLADGTGPCLFFFFFSFSELAHPLGILPGLLYLSAFFRTAKLIASFWGKRRVTDGTLSLFPERRIADMGLLSALEPLSAELAFLHVIASLV